MNGAEEAHTVFSAAHYIYIPLCVFVGVVIGWLLGGRSARAEIDRLRGLLEEEEDRQAEERVRSRDRS